MKFYCSLILSTVFICHAANAFTWAEMSYQMVIGECPSPSDKEKGDVKCRTANDELILSSEAQKAMAIASEAIYIKGLAEIRAEGIACSMMQIDYLYKDKDRYEEFIDFYAESLFELTKEKKKMESLSSAIPTDAKAKEGYKNARLRAETLLSSLPYKEVKNMRLMINSISSQSDVFGSKEMDPSMKKTLREVIKKALAGSRSEMRGNKDILDGVIYSNGDHASTASKESLAQDAELIEIYKKRNALSNAQLAPVVCAVDAKYGRGAQYRDNAILAASIIGTGGGAAVARLTIGAMSSSIAGAASIGAFSSRAAGVLRLVGSVSGASLIYDQITKECLTDHLDLSVKNGDRTDKYGRCEKDILTSLGDDHCIMNVVLSSLGGKAIFKSFKQGKYELRHGVAAWDKELATGNRAKAYRLEEATDLPSVKKENAELVKNYNKTARNVAEVNAPINMTINGINRNLPKKMKQKIISLKRTIENIKLDAPNFSKKNTFTNASVVDDISSFLPGDSKMSKALLDAYDDLHNKQKFADYLEDLIGETARKMLASTDEAIRLKAAEGLIDQETLISVLKERLIRRGVAPVLIPSGGVLNFKKFQSFLRQGPIIDEAFGPESSLVYEHGKYPHILQLDFVLPTIEKTIGRADLPLVFEYFGTNKGLAFWNETFDLFSGQTRAFTNTTFLKQNIMNMSGLNLP